jgi:glutathione S-transferase
MDAHARLITIPLSHYCEKARWALDLAGLPYVERGHAPALHRLFLVRHRTTTAPVLVTRERTLCGSDRILEHAVQAGRLDLLGREAGERAAIASWLRVADDRLGPDTRAWFYTFATEDRDLFVRLLGTRVGRPERRVMATVQPAIGGIIRWRFGLGPRTREKTAARIEDVLAEADAQRAGSRYLVGDRFTAADLAFAALGAPLVFPERYCGGSGIPDAHLSIELLAAVEGWRATPSGRAIGELYALHRPASQPHPGGGTTP